MTYVGKRNTKVSKAHTKKAIRLRLHSVKQEKEDDQDQIAISLPAMHL